MKIKTFDMYVVYKDATKRFIHNLSRVAVDRYTEYFDDLPGVWSVTVRPNFTQPGNYCQPVAVPLKRRP